MENALMYNDVGLGERGFVVKERSDRRVWTFDRKIEAFRRQLELLAEEAIARPLGSPAIARLVDEVLFGMAGECARYERDVCDRTNIARKQQELRERTDHIFCRSYFMNRARTWPQGYQGDYLTLESVYRNTPLSDGIGYYLDLHFLTSVLAKAVRGRLETLCGLLARELSRAPDLRVLNIACGSSRELFHLAPLVRDAAAKIIGVDFDSDALQFSLNRITQAGIPEENLQFRKYNALRMVSPARNLSEFGKQDIIYSVGLYDYLEDDVLVRMFSALYALLNPGGKLVLSFKDSLRYQYHEYHWYVNWNGFAQRSKEQIDRLLERTDIPAGAFEIMRDPSGVILFYVATKA